MSNTKEKKKGRKGRKGRKQNLQQLVAIRSTRVRKQTQFKSMFIASDKYVWSRKQEFDHLKRWKEKREKISILNIILKHISII